MKKIDLLHKIRIFKREGLSNLLVAKVLWSLHFEFESVWYLQLSAEFYLKTIWMRNKTFEDEDDLNRQLKNLNHDILKIFDKKIDQSDRDTLLKKGITIHYIPPNKLRYIESGHGCSSNMFKDMIKAINSFRDLLEEDLNGNIIEEVAKNNLVTSSIRDEYCAKIEEILSAHEDTKK